MATPQHKNPFSGGNEIYNFGIPFLGHHYYILYLSNGCPRGKKIKHITIRPCPSTRTLALGVMQFITFADPYLVIMTTYVDRLINAQEQRRGFLKEIHQVYTFYPKHTCRYPWSRGHEIYNFLSPYPPRNIAYHIWLRLAKLFLKRRC